MKYCTTIFTKAPRSFRCVSTQLLFVIIGSKIVAIVLYGEYIRIVPIVHIQYYNIYIQYIQYILYIYVCTAGMHYSSDISVRYKLLRISPLQLTKNNRLLCVASNCFRNVIDNIYFSPALFFSPSFLSRRVTSFLFSLSKISPFQLPSSVTPSNRAPTLRNPPGYRGRPYRRGSAAFAGQT